MNNARYCHICLRSLDENCHLLCKSTNEGLTAAGRALFLLTKIDSRAEVREDAPTRLCKSCYNLVLQDTNTYLAVFSQLPSCELIKRIASCLLCRKSLICVSISAIKIDMTNTAEGEVCCLKASRRWGRNSKITDLPCPVGRLTNVSLSASTDWRASFWWLLRSKSNFPIALRESTRCESNNYEQSIISPLQDDFFVRKLRTQVTSETIAFLRSNQHLWILA